MPVNLNALLRYKTIDSCLNNTNINCSIEYLIEKCSESLYDATGSQNKVSERTIRNDIRILRSDILGFNAPIIVKNGVYKYKKSNYSIFNKPFTDIELLVDIQDLLVEEFYNIKNKNLPHLLGQLTLITGKKVEDKFLHIYKPSPPGIFESKMPNYYLQEIGSYMRSLKPIRFFLFKKKPNPIIFNWKFIFKAV